MTDIDTQSPVLLFAGDIYYPGGGWCDYVGEFPTVSDAQQHINDTATRTDVWAHIVSEGRIVFVWSRSSHRLRGESPDPDQLWEEATS